VQTNFLVCLYSLKLSKWKSQVSFANAKQNRHYSRDIERLGEGTRFEEKPGR